VRPLGGLTGTATDLRAVRPHRKLRGRRAGPLAYESALSTSPGSGCRPSFFFEKTVRPFAVTSSTPPDDGISRTDATSRDFDLSISSVTRTAWVRYPQLVQYSIAISSLSATLRTSPTAFLGPSVIAYDTRARYAEFAAAPAMPSRCRGGR